SKAVEFLIMLTGITRFRWAECQLDALRKCLTLPMLRKALDSLPLTLNETYARILCNIDASYSRLAARALQWLVYSERPLKIQELVEVLAIDVEDECIFDPDRRLPEHDDILLICSSLVTIAVDSNRHTRIVRLAHFSVKEYLISAHISAGPAATYTVENLRAHMTIAEDCMSYLIQIANGDLLREWDPSSISVGELSVAYPLVNYAARRWIDHVRVVGEENERLSALILKLFQSHVFGSWIYFIGSDAPDIDEDDILPSKDEMDSWRLPWACRNELPRLVNYLLETGSDPQARDYLSFNALDGAVKSCNIEVVSLLLEKGADVNAQGDRYDSALKAASFNRSYPVVKLLLEAGANVNIQNGSVLLVASSGGSYPVVKLLLEAGADVNAQRDGYGSALWAASLGKAYPVVKLLLEAGANVNAQGGRFGMSALQAASFSGSHSVVKLLLEAGADVNIQGGRYGSALRAAVKRNHEPVVRLLLEKGARVDPEGHSAENVLKAALHSSSETVARLVLDKVDDTDLQNDLGKRLLATAIEVGSEAMAKLLYDKGARIENPTMERLKNPTYLQNRIKLVFPSSRFTPPQ
ncbi:MAG: hypothetical protein Q9225_004913, partial [Loekoesia sp. 1 TL-2023]